MYKRIFNYKFTNLLNLKGNKYYWTSPNPKELNKLSIIEQKYNIPKDVIHLLKEQEKNINEINDKLKYLQENQQKIIENIYNKSNNYNQNH